MRGDVRVAVRCGCGLPAVIETHPLVDGEPFPTLYWLTCRRANHAIGRLEAAGVMRDLTERLRTDEDFARSYEQADADYRRRRDARHPLTGCGGIGGGPSDRIKCLHAQYAHHLVCECNPVGAWVADQIGDVLQSPPCV
ncbi:MAG: DUF501 domain-containing protein [Actinomycetota bacterium]